MYYLHQELVRAHLTERLDQAHDVRRAQQLLRAKRQARRDERAALQARLARARSL